MFSIEMSFGRINLIQDDIAEIIMNDQVEITLGALRVTEELLDAYLKPPYSVLVNTRHNYFIDFEARRALAKLSQLHALAIVCYQNNSRFAIEAMAKIRRPSQWAIQAFDRREEALSWLSEEQEQVKQVLTESAS